MNILQTTDLKKYYGTEPNITKALDGVTLSIEEGEFVAIVGTSGSGKSTLLNMMGGLDTPTSGSIKVKGKELSKLKDEQLTIFRRRNIGFIFQNYNLVPVLNVYENIVLPVELDGDTVDKRFMDEVVKMLALDAIAGIMPTTTLLQSTHVLFFSAELLDGANGLRRRKNTTTTARIAPSCITTWNISVKFFEKSIVKSRSRRIMCPVLDMGSHSVIPSTIPMRTA